MDKPPFPPHVLLDGRDPPPLEPERLIKATPIPYDWVCVEGLIAQRDQLRAELDSFKAQLEDARRLLGELAEALHAYWSMCVAPIGGHPNPSDLLSRTRAAIGGGE